MDAEKIAKGLTEAQRVIICRTPLQQPAPAWLIADGNTKSRTVAAFGRSHDYLFTRFQANGGQRIEYRLSPLGIEVRRILQENPHDQG